MPTTAITSRQHAVVRRFKDAAAGRGGDDVLLDGEHLLAEALSSGVQVDLVLARDPASPVAREAARAGADVRAVTNTVLDAASPVRTPSGIVAIARWAPATVRDALAASVAHAVGLVDVQDPGNVGAVIRSADAFGGAGVLALGATASPAGWKALRGAMGSTFRIGVGRGSLPDAIAAARSAGRRIAAAVPADGTPVNAFDWREPSLILLGSEGAGLPEAARREADVHLTIPMRPGVNSLNVAMTAAVLLYEAWRTSPASAVADR